MQSVGTSISSQLNTLARSGGNFVYATSGASAGSVTSTSAGLTKSDMAFLQGLTGVPFKASGEPDFDAVRANGGKAEGAIPGGYDVAGLCDGENVVEFFAAQVTNDRASGVLTGDLNPRYMKGMLLQIGTTGSAEKHRQFIQHALDYMNALSEKDVPGTSGYRARATFEASV